MKVELDLSERQFGVLRLIRKAFGKPSIEVRLKKHDRKNMIANLLTIRRGTLVKGEQFVVFCLDVSVFIHRRIAMLRGITSDQFRVKFGVDYGQSFLKVTLTVTDASYHCAGEQIHP